MAVFTSNTANGYHLRLEITERTRTQANINDNVTVIDEVLRLYATNTYFQALASGNLITNANTSWSLSNQNVLMSGFNSNIVLYTGFKTIEHTDDGSKTITVKSSFSTADQGALWRVPPLTINTTMALSTIPRATTPTVNKSKANFGTDVVISTPRASTSFTHKIFYKVGSDARVEIASAVTTSHTWTIPNSLMNKIPNTMTLGITLIVETYNGSTLIGTKNTSVVGEVGASVRPTFTTITHVSANTAEFNGYGKYIQSITRLIVSLTGATGTYSSTIKGYKIEVDGQLLQASSGTTQPILGSGTLELKGTVTDSRNQSFSKSVNIEVVPYKPPRINKPILPFRTNADGSANPLGAYVRIDYDVSSQEVYSEEFYRYWNKLEFRVYRRLTGASAWDFQDSVDYTDMFMPPRLEGYLVLSTYSVDHSYEFLFEVVDWENSTVSFGDVGVGQVALQILKDKIAVGKLWERGGVDVFGEIYHKNGIPVANGYSQTLPDGNARDNAYWVALPQGLYWSDSNPDLINKPTAWAMVEVTKRYDNDSDYSLRWNDVFTTISYISSGGNGNFRGWTKVVTEVERGTNYVKYSDGIMHQWGQINSTVTLNSAWGAHYYYTAPLGNFPITFHSITSCTRDINSPLLFMLGTLSSYTTTSIGTARLLHPNTGASGAINCSYYAIGRWKA